MENPVRVIATTTARLNLRAGTGKEYPVLEVLKKGAQLVVLEDLGAWLNVQAGSRIGYIDERYVTLTETGSPREEASSPDDLASMKAITTARVNLREGPGLEYAVVNTVLPGTPLDVFEDLGGWLNVFYAGRLVYVHEDFVEIKTETPAHRTPAAGSSESSACVETYAVATGEAALRSGPSETFAVLRSLSPGDEVRVLEDMGDWLNVFSEEQLGYVRAQKVQTSFRFHGTTTTVLNLRGGPGTNYVVLNVLPKNARIEILEDLGDWLDVRYEGVRGYVHANFVRVEETELPAELVQVPVVDQPAEAPPVAAAPNAVSWKKQLMAGIRARHGRLLQALAEAFGIEPGTAAAVIAAETGLLSFGDDGRLALRFENHVFWDLWGQRQPERYALHFRHDPDQPWEGHAFRMDPSQARWQGVHTGGQAAEWTAYELAADLDAEAARRSVRMGSPQIFGYRYAELGYGSVDEMFSAFAADEAAQLRGLFALIRGSEGESNGIQALRALDFPAFARYYNGEQQGEKYGAMLRAFYDEYQEIKKLQEE